MTLKGRAHTHRTPTSSGSPTTTRAVLFDVDGTLAETERDGHRVAFNEAFIAAGIDARWDAALYGDLLKIAGGRERLEYYFCHYEALAADEGESLAAALHVEKTRLFVDIVDSGRIGPRPGVRHLVRELQRRAVTAGIVTTGRRAWVAPLVAHLLGHDALDRMAVVITGDDVAELKPSPEAYLLAMDELGLDPTAGVAIEDSVNGMRSALAAGLACVVVPSLYNRNDDFSDADLVVPEFDRAPVVGGLGALIDHAEFRELVFGR